MLFASPDTNRVELREKIMAKKKDIAMFDVGFKLRGIRKCFIASLTKSFNFGRCRQVLLVSNTKALSLILPSIDLPRSFPS